MSRLPSLSTGMRRLQVFSESDHGQGEMMPMRFVRAIFWRCWCVCLGWGIALGVLPADVSSRRAFAADPQEQIYHNEIAPLLKKYCAGCHSGSQAKGGVAFETYKDLTAVRSNPRQWDTVQEQLDGHLMPPTGKPQPSQHERKKLIDWINRAVLITDCSGPLDPGRVTIRRLNRTEYNNTIRDLLGVTFRPADDFPGDDIGYGFDNNGDVLSLPSILMEKYLAAAERIATAAIVTPDPDGAPLRKFPGKNLPSVGEVHADFEVATPGNFVVTITATGDQAGPEPPRMPVKLDGKLLTTVEVKGLSGEPQKFERKLRLNRGKHRLTAGFINDYYKPDDPDPKLRGDRNLHVEQFVVRGPIGVLPSDLPESHRRLITCRPEKGSSSTDCARVIMKKFATRAFRRPVTEDELHRLVEIVHVAEKHHESFERGIQLAVQAALVSPHFLFRYEAEPGPADIRGIRVLNDYELATRLSYFLWSTLPDEELFRVAAAGTLRQTEVLDQQVRRMLADPRRKSLSENFAVQWLNLRNIDVVSPDRKTYPDFNKQLRSSMRRETELVFDAIVAEDRRIFDLLDADFTFVNERLAKHYGLPEVKGEEFKRVSLKSPDRRGLLGHASILTITSNPTRTSPVKRGKWILDNLLDDPPPPPPPGVPALNIDRPKKKHLAKGTLRQQLELHRANPACASCHARMDGLGFGLENYDGIGKWRTEDAKLPLDTSGTLPGGVSFKGPAELRSILKEKKPEFRRCLTVKLLTYALGRGIEYSDKCLVSRITAEVAERQDRFSSVVLAIVHSDAFRKRRGPNPPSATAAADRLEPVPASSGLKR